MPFMLCVSLVVMLTGCGKRLPALAESGSAGEVHAAVVRGVAVDQRGANGVTALMQSVRVDLPHQEVTRTLLEAGANVNARADDGWTPLMFALADGGNTEAVRLLLAAGADVNLAAGDGTTALMVAVGASGPPRFLAHAAASMQPVAVGYPFDSAADGPRLQIMAESLVGMVDSHAADLAVIGWLLDHGADVHVLDADGNNALSHAVRVAGDPEIVRVLLRAGATRPAGPIDGMSLLEWAAVGGDSGVVQALLAAHDAAGIDAQALSEALFVAAGLATDLMVVAAMVQAGADPNSANAGEFPPLFGAAAVNPNPDVTVALVRAGAIANAVGPMGMTPLMVAAATNPNPEVIRALLAEGADPRFATEAGTALHAAAGLAEAEVVRLLLRAGADPHVRADGVTALEVATGLNPDPEVTRVLLQAGSGADESYLGCAPIHALSRGTGHLDVLRILLEAGADLEASGEACATPLVEALRSDAAPDFVRALLGAGAGPNAMAADGWSALMHAADRYDDAALIRALLDAGADPTIAAPDGATALTRARGREQPNREIVRMLSR